MGLFFHVYGHNSVNALHLHIVDLDATGPTYAALGHKNLPLEAAMQVLSQEIEERLLPPYPTPQARPPPLVPLGTLLYGEKGY